MASNKTQSAQSNRSGFHVIAGGAEARTGTVNWFRLC